MGPVARRRFSQSLGRVVTGTHTPRVAPESKCASDAMCTGMIAEHIVVLQQRLILVSRLLTCGC